MISTESKHEQTFIEIRGLSTDTKPTANVPNGSRFVEIDTGDKYYYDQASETWLKP